MKRLILGAIIASMLAQTSISAFANLEEGDEELLFAKIPMVTVVTRMEENVKNAPGIVKVYTDKEIEKLGCHTLKDLARITPGFGIESSFGLKGYEVRGFSSGRGGFDNSRVLVMIDGIPINHGRSLYGWCQEELPLYFAKGVEFLKGPS